MQQIAIQAVPNQQLQAVLDGQNCQISIYQKRRGIFVDVNADGDDVSVAVLACDAVPLVPIGYTGFRGNLVFTDTEGTSDPNYVGLGSRFQLVYLTEAENAVLVQ